MKKVALIGCTGSVGKQTLEVLGRHRDLFEVVALVANSSAEDFCRAVERFRPAYAALTDKNAADKVSSQINAISPKTAFLSGREGGLRALKESAPTVAVIACGGFAGLEYSLEAAKMGVVIALANKESLVCGGEILMPLAGDRIAPVDSEHSAIWQCLNFEKKTPVSRLFITASGGSFRGRKWEELKDVTPAQATAHPTWKMGMKISVDSATMLNKGYEIIEAHHLYGVPYERITAVIHPQSIVHSMVMFGDGAVIAQLSYPDMILPIQMALTYPERLDTGIRKMDFTEPLDLHFEPLDVRQYPMFGLAVGCGKSGGILPTALNAASEVCVRAFAEGIIRYTDIYTVADKVVQSTQNIAAQSYENLAAADAKARAAAAQFIKEVK